MIKYPSLLVNLFSFSFLQKPLVHPGEYLGNVLHFELSKIPHKSMVSSHKSLPK